MPESWVRTSTRTHITVPPGQGISDGYGYDWWIESRGTHFFAAHGYLGQALVVVPRLDEVISITSSRDSGLGLVRLILKATHA